MLQKASLVAAMVSMSLAACGGGGSDPPSDVSATPPAPAPGSTPSTTPPPTPSPGPGQTPISAPSPPPNKVPTEPNLPPGPAGLQYAGAVLRQALMQSVPVIGRTGGSPETGQYVHDGLDNPLAGYISSDGKIIRTRTLSRSSSGYVASREAALALTESNGGLLPTMDGVLYAAEDPPLDYASSYPANQTARTWRPASGSPHYVKLIPSTLETQPGILRLCFNINTAAATRLACTHHRADGSIFGSDIIEDIGGPPLSVFSWRWAATPRTDGQPHTHADYEPGAIGGIAPKSMTCTLRFFGPGATAAETTVKRVSMTPSEVRVDDQVLLRHGSAENTKATSGDSVTYSHADADPATPARGYTIKCIRAADECDLGSAERQFRLLQRMRSLSRRFPGQRPSDQALI